MTNISRDLQAVAELADLRDALIQLARTRLSFRQVLLIMMLEFFHFDIGDDLRFDENDVMA